jgi:hypothetical protein
MLKVINLPYVFVTKMTILFVQKYARNGIGNLTHDTQKYTNTSYSLSPKKYHRYSTETPKQMTSP